MTPKVQYMTRRAPKRSLNQPPTGRSSEAGKMKVVVSSAALQFDAEVVDVVLRQPGRQGDIGTEDGRVVEAEAPHAHVLEGHEHLADRLALAGHLVAARDDDERSGSRRRRARRCRSRGRSASRPEDPEVHVAGSAGEDARDEQKEELHHRGPTLPAPKTPSANPWRSFGVHAEFQAMPTEKRLPAKPTRKASTSNTAYDPAR